MLPTKEELSKKYGSLTDQALLDILHKKENFREVAIQAVTEELKKRDVSLEDLKEYSSLKVEEEDQKELQASLDLSLMWKIVSFFFWIIDFFLFAVRMNWKEDGKTKLVKQSRFFRITGILSSFIVFYISVNIYTPFYLMITIWVLLFLLVTFIEKVFKIHK